MPKLIKKNVSIYPKTLIILIILYSNRIHYIVLLNECVFAYDDVSPRYAKNIQKNITILYKEKVYKI